MEKLLIVDDLTRQIISAVNRANELLKEAEYMSVNTYSTEEELQCQMSKLLEIQSEMNYYRGVAKGMDYAINKLKEDI